MNKEKLNKFIMLVRCDECKSEFELYKDDLKKTIVNLDGVNVHLVYFMCPKCKKIYRVSIQDRNYYKFAHDLEKAKRKLRNYNGNDGAVINKLCAKALEKKKILEKYVDLVNDTYNGTFEFVASENNYDGYKIIYHESEKHGLNKGE